MQLSGYKKVLNYMKRVEEEKKKRRALSREEVINAISMHGNYISR
jgi:hypothetical protein